MLQGDILAFRTGRTSPAAPAWGFTKSCPAATL